MGLKSHESGYQNLKRRCVRHICARIITLRTRKTLMFLSADNYPEKAFKSTRSGLRSHNFFLGPQSLKSFILHLSFWSAQGTNWIKSFTKTEERSVDNVWVRRVIFGARKTLPFIFTDRYDLKKNFNIKVAAGVQHNKFYRSTKSEVTPTKSLFFEAFNVGRESR